MDLSVPTNLESVENNQQENISLQISGNSIRRIRKKNENLQKGDRSHILVPSTQDFPSDSGNTVISSVDSIAGKNDQPLLSKIATEENRIANEKAVENFMRRIQNINMVGEDSRIERWTTTVKNSNLNQTRTNDIRRDKNFNKRQQRR